MSNIWKCLAILATLFAVVSCEKTPEVSDEEPQMNVNYKSLESVWQLAEIDGFELSAETYLYMELAQKGQVFNLYDNLDSAFSSHETGTFAIAIEDYDEFYEITGSKDFHFNEGWSESYYISSLTATTMEWTGVNNNEVLTFKRGADIVIPEGVLNGTKAL